MKNPLTVNKPAMSNRVPLDLREKLGQVWYLKNLTDYLNANSANENLRQVSRAMYVPPEVYNNNSAEKIKQYKMMEAEQKIKSLATKLYQAKKSSEVLKESINETKKKLKNAIKENVIEYKTDSRIAPIGSLKKRANKKNKYFKK